MIPNATESASTRPYLIRALYEWCTDHGFTPYLAVLVDDSVQVPPEYVRNGEIVLNISPEATSALKLGNDYIEFKARFAGTARDIMVPVERVIAIYARENGQGMAFPAPAPTVSAGPSSPAAAGSKTRALASVSSGATPAATGEARPGMQLVDASAPAAQAEGEAGTDDRGPNDTPPRPAGPGAAGAGRPALKRIK